MTSRTSEILQVDQKPIGLTKTDTVALWHAVKWMETVLREWRLGGFRDEQDRAQHEVQTTHLTNARKALRKVNKIRKGQR